MLRDITTLTNKVFGKFLHNQKKLASTKNLYDTYRALEVVVDSVNLVAKHYLALDFTEEFLQNSSYGKPEDKWRRFVNEDLETLNEALKNYLFKLGHLCFEDMCGFSSTFLYEEYNAKTFYGFVRDEYNIGFVEPCSTMLIQTLLDDVEDNRSFHIERFNKVDLSTYEQRVALQKELLVKKEELQSALDSLREYIVKRVSIYDLV
jgi:hypothetical protein